MKGSDWEMGLDEMLLLGFLVAIALILLAAAFIGR